MAASLDEEAFPDGSAHHLAKIDPGNRPSRAGPHAARVERDGESRPTEPLLQARGNQTGDAGVPPFAGRYYDRCLAGRAQCGHGLGFGLHQRRKLNSLPLAVKPIELTGKAHACGRIVLHEQIDAQRGAADAAARIDPRSEQEAEMPRLRRTTKPRGVHKGGQPRVLPPSQREQALGDKSPVEPLERHHVSNRSERNEIEKPQEVRLRPLRRPEISLPELTIERNECHEHDTDCGEMSKLGEIIEPIGVHDRDRGRKLLIGLMMVDDNDIHSQLARLKEPAWLVVPQSTVTSRLAPCCARPRIASAFGP